LLLMHVQTNQLSHFQHSAFSFHTFNFQHGSPFCGAAATEITGLTTGVNAVTSNGGNCLVKVAVPPPPSLHPHLLPHPPVLSLSPSEDVSTVLVQHCLVVQKLKDAIERRRLVYVQSAFTFGAPCIVRTPLVFPILNPLWACGVNVTGTFTCPAGDYPPPQPPPPLFILLRDSEARRSSRLRLWLLPTDLS